MTLRLDSVAPGLGRKLAEATPDTQRRVAVAAAEYAVRRVNLTGPEVEDALAALRSGLRAGSALRDRLESLCEALDEEQWNIQERVDAGQALESEHLAAFSKARAATALYYATDDPQTACAEALYEALATVDDQAELRDLVDRQLVNE